MKKACAAKQDARFPESAGVPFMLMDIAFLHVLAALAAAHSGAVSGLTCEAPRVCRARRGQAKIKRGDSQLHPEPLIF
jgi:hypothetical protein